MKAVPSNMMYMITGICDEGNSTFLTISNLKYEFYPIKGVQGMSEN